ncbi:MAG: hypothetical protein ACYCX6_12485, partial [Vulcanimicrobiaceae bacterium]
RSCINADGFHPRRRSSFPAPRMDDLERRRHLEEDLPPGGDLRGVEAVGDLDDVLVVEQVLDL